MTAQARLLANGRLHLQHGPIDLIVDAAPFPFLEGRAESAKPNRGGVTRAGCPQPARAAARVRPPVQGGMIVAHAAAIARFSGILGELCAELPLLRQPARPDRSALEGVVARRMWASVAPFAGSGFITPMAAVAGAVAEEILRAMTAAADLRRASVNNGGDIALHLAPGERVRIGLVDRPDRCDRRGRPALFGTTTIRAEDGIRGIATSGWRGRSFSLGIADAVTVLARTAADADAAATAIANAVDLPGHPAVRRVPARAVQADSDLGDRPVTRDVGALAPADIEAALAAGLGIAQGLVRRGLIAAAALHLQGRTTATSGAPIHRLRHAEESGEADRLEARTDRGGACFETRTSGPPLSMTALESGADSALSLEIAA